MNEQAVTLSAVIITFNEEAKIGSCIQSLQKVADEILVLDSFSTDRTPEICREAGVRFVQHSFDGYIEQKNRAWNMATGTHVLSLDADEALSNVLLSSIETEKKKGFPFDAYTMNRMTAIGDTWIRHGSWYPDRKLRLARKSLAHWGGVNPHDKLIVDTNTTIKHLKGDLLHYSFTDIEAFKKQGERFSTISANALYQRGKKSSLLKIYLNPLIAFVKSYLIKKGYLDGKAGYQIAKEIARQTKMKYRKLRDLNGN